MGYLLGGCLIVACIVIPWQIIESRRANRRFEALRRGMEAGKARAWRELGINEETIAFYHNMLEERLGETKW